jgi:hypothetical protein
MRQLFLIKCIENFTIKRLLDTIFNSKAIALLLKITRSDGKTGHSLLTFAPINLTVKCFFNHKLRKFSQITTSVQQLLRV